MANISHFTQTVNGVSTTYDIHDANAIPRSGGAVFSGVDIKRIDNNQYIELYSSSDISKGGSFGVYSLGDSLFDPLRGTFRLKATDGTTNYYLNGSRDGFLEWSGVVIRPASDNECSLGDSYHRWSTVYSATSAINTSDSRLKNTITDIDDSLLDAWENIEPKQYKFNDATEKKGEKARFHTGYLAQNIQAECEKHGINAADYGLFCYDEWEEQEEISEEIETEKDGKIVKEKRIIQPKREKGNLYALRYEEALVVECKYLRRCIAKLTARIEELEKEKEAEK